jgi:hypothetical protein
MACCGGKGRSSQRKYVPGVGYAYIRWEGQGPIKAHGGVTGKMYRFDGYGSVVPVDQRDGNVKGIPGMREVGQ